MVLKVVIIFLKRLTSSCGMRESDFFATENPVQLRIEVKETHVRWLDCEKGLERNVKVQLIKVEIKFDPKV